jgi:hypothetical protein
MRTHYSVNHIPGKQKFLSLLGSKSDDFEGGKKIISEDFDNEIGSRVKQTPKKENENAQITN